MIIQCDDREPKSMEVTAKLVGGLEFLRKRMEEGDYVWKDVCIERKTVDDFCGSIMNGRFEKQVKRMKEKYKWVYVLVSGRISDRTTEMHEHCILGKMAALLVNHQVPVICVDDDFQLCYLLKRIFERHKEVGNGKWVV